MKPRKFYFGQNKINFYKLKNSYKNKLYDLP